MKKVNNMTVFEAKDKCSLDEYSEKVATEVPALIQEAKKEINKKVINISENDIKQDSEIAILKTSCAKLEEQVKKDRDNMINLIAEGENIHIEDASDLEAEFDISGNMEQYEQSSVSPSPENPSEVECIKTYNIFNSELELGGYSGGNGLPYNMNTRIRNKTKINLPKGTYTISCEEATLISLTLWNENNTYEKEINTKSNSLTFSVSENKLVNITIENKQLLDTKIQLNKGIGTKHLPYGNIGIKITGKNSYNNIPLQRGLWIAENTIGSNNSGWYVIVPIIGGKEHIITKKNTIGSIYATTTAEYPQQGTPIIDKWTGSSNQKELKITTSQNAKYLFIGLFAGNPTEIQQKQCMEELQVEEGNTATLYEPYKETIVPIDLKGNELCGIEETKDILNIDSNGKTTIDKKYAKYVFTGEETFSFNTRYENSNIYQFNRDDFHIIKGGEYDKIFVKSNYFKGISRNQITADNFIGVTLGNNVSRVLINAPNNSLNITNTDNDSTKIAKFKQWLKDKYNTGNPVYVIYELETSQTIQLANTNISLYKGVNNIMLLTNINTKQKVTYIADTKTYVDNKISNLEQQVNTINELLSTTKTSSVLLDNLQTDIESEVL